MNTSFVKLIFTSLILLIGSLASAQTPILSYNFENGAQDDSGTYAAVLQGGATIIATTDGNHLLSTGAANGFLDLGALTGKNVLAQLTADYTISVDIYVSASGNSLASYCWVYAFANGTSQYLGLINRAGNTNWYYEIKNGSTSNLNTDAGISTGVWHNITVVQNGANCIYYYDGVQKISTAVSLKPASFAASVWGCFLGKSPFSADAYMKNTLIDNFRIYDSALSASEVQALYAARPTSATPDPSAGPSALETQLLLDLKTINRGNKCAYLHENLTLPATGSTVGTYTYAVSGSGLAADGTVTLTGSEQQATLSITLTDGATSIDTTLQVRIAPDDNRSAYLFTHFRDNSTAGQQLLFALADKDTPLQFKTILNGQPVIAGSSIASTGAIRDPHIQRGEDGYFYMTMTDMDCQNGWWSNHAMVLMKSKNLVDWQHAVVDFATKFPTWQLSSGATAVWAPQVIWDPEYQNTNGTTGRYMVYYSLRSENVGNTIHFYYNYANDNFTDLIGSPTELLPYSEGGSGDIDAEILWSENDSIYHLFYTDGGIKQMLGGTSLSTSIWTPANYGENYNGSITAGVEGSATYRKINSNAYLMLFDTGSNYYYSQSDDNMATFPAFQVLDKTYITPRHGSVVTLKPEEENVLRLWDKLYPLVEGAKTIQTKGRGNAALTAALNAANAALHQGYNAEIATVATAIASATENLAVWLSRYKLAAEIQSAQQITQIGAGASALQQAIATATAVYDNAAATAENLDTATDDLKNAAKNYFKAIVAAPTTTDQSASITNATFDAANSTGWNGTTPAFGSGVAEFYNKTFDFYRTITGLQNGYYLLSVQGFYRNGANDAGLAYATATEDLNALLYAGTLYVPLASLYSVPYTGTNSKNGFVDGMTGANNAFSANNDNFANYLIVQVTGGSLKIGLKKTATVATDWVCFDNFKLYKINTDQSALNNVGIDTTIPPNTPIYDLLGAKVGTFGNIDTLGCGVYILKNKKIFINEK
ncbi:MAG: hypothetical protein LBR66_03045 [Candidatus Symbiothrix sp.]|nr:hypothetical protein [Candidatus Symbiothrix sp.]